MTQENLEKELVTLDSIYTLILNWPQNSEPDSSDYDYIEPEDVVEEPLETDLEFFFDEILEASFEARLPYKLALSLLDGPRISLKRLHYVQRKRAHWRFPRRVRHLFVENSVVKKGATASLVLRRWLKRLSKKRFRFTKKYHTLFTTIKRWKRAHLSRRISSLKLTRLVSWSISKKQRNVFPITRRVFLTQKRLKKILWKSLYKHVKNKLLLSQVIQQKKQYLEPEFFSKKRKKKTIFLNVYRPLISKLRRARIVHWGIRTRGKLNEYRYNKLLAFELQQVPELHYLKLLYIYIFHTYVASLSWRQMLNLFSYNLIFLNGVPVTKFETCKKGDLIELPFGPSLLARRLRLKKVFFKIVKRARRLSYKSFLGGVRRNKFVKKYKVVPKLFKRLPFGFKQLGKFLAIAPGLGSLAVIKQLPAYQFNPEKKLLITSVLTLQNWRYRFD